MKNTSFHFPGLNIFPDEFCLEAAGQIDKDLFYEFKGYSIQTCQKKKLAQIFLLKSPKNDQETEASFS